MQNINPYSWQKEAINKTSKNNKAARIVRPSRSNRRSRVTKDGNNFGFHLIWNLSGLRNRHIFKCCQIKRYFIIPVAWFEKIFFDVQGVLFIQQSLVPDHLPGFGTITQLIGVRKRRQIPQIGKAADDFENA